MASRSAVPAVEYRNLVTQLSLQRERDPENDTLRQLMRELIAIGNGAGALTHGAGNGSDEIPGLEGARFDSAFDWDAGELAVTPHQARIVATVADVTRIPE